MKINYIGQSAIYTPSRKIRLNNVLHAPQATKNLASIHRLTTDNHIYLEYHPSFFLVKDLDTRRTILRGRCRGGLYPFPSLDSSSGKLALSVTKPSIIRWHDRLGHPSSVIVNKVLDKHSLSFSKESNREVCDACQLGKSYQLPFPKSTSVSKGPLDLIFSNVWGAAPSSAGNK